MGDSNAAAGRGRPANPQPRRVPTQRRSRERVDRILAAATAIIAEQGSDAMRMSEVAERAGIPIASIYQYFPDKAAIIAELARRYNERGLACVSAELATVGGEADLPAGLERVVDGYYEMFIAEPVMRDIWWATRADRRLHELEEEDVEAHAALLTDVLTRLRPEQPRAALSALALVTMQLIATTVRLAVSVPPDRGEEILKSFKRMVPANVLGSLEPHSGRGATAAPG